MADLLQTGISGLRTSQRGLATTSHNISNVNTDGYSRQRVEQDTNPPEYTGRGAIGRGSNVQTIQRMSEETRVEALRENHAEFERLDTLQEMSGRVDNLLADKEAGISPAMQGFFNAVEEVANDPANTTTRQQMITQGEALVDRFDTVDDRLLRLEHDVNRRLELQAEEVNGLANAIAELNEQIRTRWQDPQRPPNDLLDQRDEKIRQLSELVDVRVHEQRDGVANVGIGRGQPLVTGNRANELAVTENPYDPQRPELSLRLTDGERQVSGVIDGGSVGGLLEFRREVLDPVRDEIGRVATSIAAVTNEQHNRGVHFDRGDPEQGEDFFNIGQPGVSAHAENGSDARPELHIDRERIGELTGDNYRLRYDGDGNQWHVENLNTGEVRTLDEDIPRDDAGRYRFDGLILEMPYAGEARRQGFEDGDRFELTPTREGAREMETRITRPQQVAAASPVTVGEATDERGQSSNTGTARIGSPQVGDPEGVMASLGDIGAREHPRRLAETEGVLKNGIELVFRGDEGRGYFEVENLTRADAGDGQEGEIRRERLGTIEYNPEDMEEGVSFNLGQRLPEPPDKDLEYSLEEQLDLEVRLSGRPDPGDRFAIGGNYEGIGDNTNALRLAERMEEPIMDHGNSSFQEAYSAMVGQVGGETQRVQTNRDAQETLLHQAEEQWEAVSGVNLDEEAANMMEYQQAYQAAARIITTADEVFQEMLASVRR